MKTVFSSPRNTINVWISKQVILHVAQSVLSPQEMDKSKQLEEYKNDLILFDVIQKLSHERLDTSVSEVEIEEYYDNNPKDFELARNIIKLKFYKFKPEAEDEDELWQGFLNEDMESLEILRVKSGRDGNYFENEKYVGLF